MGILELALVAIKGLSLVTNNPALGGGSSVQLKEASELLGLLGELISRGKEGHKELKDFTAVIEEMAETGRAPTMAQWDELRARSDAAHSVIQEAAAAAKKEEEPEPEPEPEATPEPTPEGEPTPEAEVETEESKTE